MSHHLFAHIFVAILTGVLSLPAVSFAQTTARDQAEARNDAGKALYKSKNYVGAVHEFEQAIKLSADARYYFNLCATHEKLGQYELALNACDDVYQHEPEDRLKGKTGKRAANIRRLMREQGGGNSTGTDPGTGTGTDPGTGTGTDSGTGTGTGASHTGTALGDPLDPAVGEVEAAVEPGLNYKWSLGIDLGGAFGSSLSSIDLATGVAIKGYADFFVAPQARLGVRLYGNWVNFTTGDTMVSQMRVFDVGGGAYFHQRLFGSIYFTPMASVGMAIVYPDTPVDNPFVMAGFRGEAAVQWVLGLNHVVSFSPLNVAVYTGSGRDAAAAHGLNKAGAIWSVTLGYTYRFQKSFQQIVTLE